MLIVIKISDEAYEKCKKKYENLINGRIGQDQDISKYELCSIIANGILLTPNVLSDMLIDKRIKGELKK